MKRTIVELARAMIDVWNLPEFLWEPSVAHAAYVQNRSYTQALTSATLYETMHGTWVNVMHFRKFGLPLWILNDGPNTPNKSYLKPHRKYLWDLKTGHVRSNTIPRTHGEYSHPKITNLLKQTLPTVDETMDSSMDRHDRGPGMETTPVPAHNMSFAGPHKRKSYGEVNLSSWKMRGVYLDYKQLEDLFSDTDEDKDSMIFIQFMIYDEAYNAATNDAPINLKQAKNSADWVEWKHMIGGELEQLQDIGTWEIVDKPLDVIPITSKWVFVKKTDLMGEIVKHKSKLVIKGCSQHPRFDFNETYLPVVQIETVRILLAMVPSLNFRLQQMDIKGAYPNGILKETIYMKQPKGFFDGTDQVCQLNKTLYGLKQSGHEWNNQLDHGLQSIGF